MTRAEVTTAGRGDTAEILRDSLCLPGVGHLVVEFPALAQPSPNHHPTLCFTALTSNGGQRVQTAPSAILMSLFQLQLLQNNPLLSKVVHMDRDVLWHTYKRHAPSGLCSACARLQPQTQSLTHSLAHADQCTIPSTRPLLRGQNPEAKKKFVYLRPQISSPFNRFHFFRRKSFLMLCDAALCLVQHPQQQPWGFGGPRGKKSSCTRNGPHIFGSLFKFHFSPEELFLGGGQVVLQTQPTPKGYRGAAAALVSL